MRWIACMVMAGVFAGCAAITPPLPDPLVMQGKRVATQEQWQARRAEMRDILQREEYGFAPPVPAVTVAESTREDIHFPESNLWATKVMVRLAFDGLTMEAGYWIPRGAQGPLPVILAMEPVWWPNPFVVNHQVERVLAHGFILAGFNHNDLASFEDPKQRPAMNAHPDCDWGVVAVGAWGYRVALNWLEADPAADARHVAIWGHSRRGKSCLLAGALDERFAAVIPHMSGMAGAALYRVRGEGGQRLDQLLEQYWLHPNIFAYNGRECELAFDQHWLHALVAPRPMYSHVGARDAWGNPDGERAACRAARPVYAWLNAPENLGIYIGDCDHYDPNGPEGGDSWETLLQFLEWKFRNVPPAKNFALK